ncbi:MAG: TIR domain-containing protein, partial [Hyphomicrobiaceae bacterium]|nr:TIR domain-containing protein [Hyphomicrobiaceae bacterium]
MANIYISYSSRDERAVLGLKSWLREHGYEALLVDRLKRQEQGAFEELEPVLLEAINASELVIFLVTPFWEASKLCQWELDKVQALSKSHMAILEAPATVTLADSISVIDMTRNRDKGLTRLREELKRLLSSPPGEKPSGTQQEISELPLQGTVIARHDRGKTKGSSTKETPVSPVQQRQEGVNRTLKILHQGIRWSAFPGWLTRFLKLPVAGTKIKERAMGLSPLKKKLSFKRPSFTAMAKRIVGWLTGGTARMAGAAFLLFVFVTALIAMMSDGPLGSKSVMRKELADVKKRQSLFLTKISNHLRGTGDVQTSLLLGLEALEGAQGQEDRFKARDALYSAFVKERKKLVFRGHDNHASGAMFSPDGRYILSSSWDRTVRIWQIAAPRRVQVIDQHEGFVNTARFNQQQTLILTAALDNKARLFSARTGKLVRVLKGHNHDLTSASFS